MKSLWMLPKCVSGKGMPHAQKDILRPKSTDEKDVCVMCVCMSALSGLFSLCFLGVCTRYGFMTKGGWSDSLAAFLGVSTKQVVDQ